VPLWSQIAIQHHLRNSSAVAQIEKDQIAMIAPPVHPAHQHHLLAGIRCAQFTAQMRPLQLANKIEHFKCPLRANDQSCLALIVAVLSVTCFSCCHSRRKSASQSKLLNYKTIVILSEAKGLLFSDDV
jgi:hypothetical protein